MLFRSICGKAENNYDTGYIIARDPQQIMLPFRCEEVIVSWECQLYPNDLVHDQLGEVDEHGQIVENEDQQFFNVLVVTLRRLREKRKVVGGSRKIL